jgi:hypothetical protein
LIPFCTLLSVLNFFLLVGFGASITTVVDPLRHMGLKRRDREAAASPQWAMLLLVPSGVILLLGLVLEFGVWCPR